ncbi:MAG: class I tRNA ligase family protein [Candidatus Vogelbacteria bacterium]|nr:class I tRNA ligase family protein [Candidatus Vogelbacteria bacterium]
MAEPEKETKSNVAKREEEILEFWRTNKIFEQTESRPGKAGDFVFYDGPPFANGLPHFGHLLPTSIKDAIPRYQTMKGKRVFRRWGWDCHGLPVENVVEKELGLKVKKDIETLGIDVFNEAARASVLRYASDWKEVIYRMGRWVDMENDYKTMNPTYTESIWWIFKILHDKNLIYQGFKSMQLCPRCETTLSNFEVNQGYKDITDISVTVKFELVDEPGTYLLAWTTTPWTLSGNVALAVNKEVEYVKVVKDGKFYILAKNLVEKNLKSDYEIVEQFNGEKLVGKKYKPVFDHYSKDEKLVNRDNGWQVYGADFVTTEDGTGIVHIAPAFGEDDMKLGQQYNLPFIQHVGTNGEFKLEVTDLAGKQAKPKDDHQATDIEVIKLLAAKEVLFAKEKIVHSYPHCWRCDTPLLNYASSSWFVKVTDFKDKLIANNQQINWIPDHIKDGRFGKWLEGARDWAISRSRFWGAPLPVWKCDSCEKSEVLGSVEDLVSKLPTRGNKFILMRHGEAGGNVRDVISDDPTEVNKLSETGRSQVSKTASGLKDIGITKIFASPFVRTQETAKLVAETIGFPIEDIVTEEKIRELKTGGFNGKPWAEFNAQFKNRNERFFKALPGGETIHEISARMLGAIMDINNSHENETILVVSHGLPLFLAEQYLNFKTIDDLLKIEKWSDLYFKTGEAREAVVRSYPHNKNYELDLHRPYIDEFKWTCSCGGNLIRVSDVFDCWFESGSMPYAQAHYPFGDKNQFDPETNQNFPADFIAEGLDQTRGWFYSLSVLSTALFNKPVFKNVIVNGLILAEDGQKMSKKLKNYPDLHPTIDKYGADALRFYLLGCPSVRAEEFAFSERTLSETSRRVIARLQNVISFYEMYADKDLKIGSEKSDNILDLWITSRLNQVTLEVGKALDNYELDRAVRPIDDFIDDLSNWYIRRSRDRFKSEDIKDRTLVKITTSHVLLVLAKIMAPLTPFIAEDIFQKLKNPEDQISVHLTDWPVATSFDEVVIADMAEARIIVEQGLRLRAEAGIKVRQPLAQLMIKKTLSPAYLVMIAEEVNVKNVSVDETLSEPVQLDTNITSELKEEGLVRDLIRHIQELRKSNGLLPTDIVSVVISTDPDSQILVEKYQTEILRVTNSRSIVFELITGVDSLLIDGRSFSLALR